ETTARSTGRSTLNLRALTLELIRMGGAGPRAAAGLTAVSAAANAQGTALMRARAGMAAYSTATNSATAATSRFATVSRTALMGTGITAALIAIVAAVDMVTKAFASAEDKASAYFENLPNGGTGLAEAIAQDTAAAREGGTVYREYTEWGGAAGARNADTADQIRQAAGAQTQAKDATEQTNAALDNQVRVLGDASKAWLANSLATEENCRKLWEQKDVLAALGFSLEEFRQRTLESPKGGKRHMQGPIGDFNEVDATGKTGYEPAGIALD